MVSIIIALHNGEKFISETIESALAQTVETEVIVVDDCSSDDSVHIVENMQKSEKRILLYYNEENVGFCQTANKGICKASGDYLLVLGQDDVLSPEHCEKMISKFSEGIAMVYCDYEFIDEAGVVFDSKPHCSQKDLQIIDFYRENALPSPGLMIRKDVFVSTGGYLIHKKFPNYGEYFAWINVALAGEIRFCNEVRAYYRRHANNISNEFETWGKKRKLCLYRVECRKTLLKSNSIPFIDKLRILVYDMSDLMRICYYFIRSKDK